MVAVSVRPRTARSDDEEALFDASLAPRGSAAGLVPPEDALRRDAPRDFARSPTMAKPFSFYLGVFFMTIASVLGTGILGLPVKLSASGFSPFLVTFSVCLLVQLIIVDMMVEILQRARVLQGLIGGPARRKHDDEELLDVLGPNVPTPMLPPGGAGVPLPRSDEESVHGEGPGGEGAPGHRRGAGTLQVDLHSLGQLFLASRWLRWSWDFVVLFHFVAILISYALAGSTAYGQLMGVDQRALIGPFVIFGALFIVFGARVVDPFISVFTLAKGALLVAMVGVALAVGVSIGQQASSSWASALHSFLISTVAMGGVVNVMPVAFSKVPLVASELRRLRAAISLGIITCWALNVAWCAAVLMIVPQNGDDSAISLRRAADRGEISTVPVIQIIMTGYRQHAWIAGVITLFIVVSITVSFITLGNALKHTLDGLAVTLQHSLLSARVPPWLVPPRRLSLLGACLSVPRLMRAGLYVAHFGAILAVAAVNPQGFLVVMEAACSLALNLECGIFVVLMLAAARTFSLNPPGSDPGPPGPPPTLLGVLKRWILPVAGDNTGVPLPASSISSLAQPVVCVYFAFAVGYDFYIHTAGTRVF